LPATDPVPRDRTAAPLSVRALVVLAGVAVVVYVLDQISKALVVANLQESQPLPVLGDLLTFQFVRNSGAAFSLASGSTWIFTIVASAVTVFIVMFARRIRSTGWAVLFGMLLGGTLGNLTDRYFREPGFPNGHVIDFLQIPLLPAIFNIADVAIVSSMAVFLILTLRGVGLDGRRLPGQHVRRGRARRHRAPARRRHERAHGRRQERARVQRPEAPVPRP
jgi:signal peptidase II